MHADLMIGWMWCDYEAVVDNQAQYKCTKITIQTQCKCNTNTTQMQYKYNTNTTQIQYKYNANPIKVQHKYTTNPIEMQHRYNTNTLQQCASFQRAVETIEVPTKYRRTSCASIVAWY